MACVRAIDEPGVTRADPRHACAHISGVRGGVRPRCRESGPGSAGNFGGSGGLPMDRRQPQRHDKGQERRPESRAADPIHACLALLVRNRVSNADRAT